MRASQILDIPVSLWEKIGGQTVTRIVKDADKGIGYKGKFPPYKSEIYKQRKSKGKAALKGVGASRQISPPNLRLTSVMLNSISAQDATKYGVDIIFRDGLKVEGNAKRGRDIYGISRKNEKIIEKDLGVYLGKQIDKYAKIPIDMKVG